MVIQFPEIYYKQYSTRAEERLKTNVPTRGSFGGNFIRCGGRGLLWLLLLFLSNMWDKSKGNTSHMYRNKFAKSLFIPRLVKSVYVVEKQSNVVPKTNGDAEILG